MKKLRATLCLLALAAPLAATEKRDWDFTVRLYNWADVPLAVVSRAASIASKAFAVSGIHSRWLDCRPGRTGVSAIEACNTPAEPADLRFSLVNRVPPATAPAVLALTTYDEDGATGRATVLWKRVRLVARGDGVSEAAVLGSVFAHEAGHLLLGRQSHSRHGIMKARLDIGQIRLAARGALAFSEPESKRILAGITLQRRKQPGVTLAAAIRTQPVPVSGRTGTARTVSSSPPN